MEPHHHHKVRYSKEQIQELRSTFDEIDGNQNGTISKREFLAALKKGGVYISKGSIDFAWKVADKDHTLGIDFEEFLDFYWLLNHP
jgi:Ca2+-binding EF-hand superfamily protein